MKYIFMAFIALFLAWCMLKSACTNKEWNKEKETSTLGEYVYIDEQGILHTRLCYMGLKITDKEGNTYRKSVTRISVTDISSNDLNRCCQCVTDEQYNQLKKMTEIIDWQPEW